MRPSAATNRLVMKLFRSALVALVVLGALSACTSGSLQKVSVYQREGFEHDETYSRLVDAPAPAACEAARRALLSQGYLIGTHRPDAVVGTKSFQPEGEVHVQISFHVACLPEGRSGQISTAFVSAIQDRYVLKKSANSASVGVNALGSLSIPLGASGDSLVKVGSETIPAGAFYDRFFASMKRYLVEAAAEEGAPALNTVIVPPTSASSPQRAP